MLTDLDISSLPEPRRPRNSENPAASVVDPEIHSAETAEAAPSKSSSSRTTSGTHKIVGAPVGAVEGLPGVTVGPAVVGAPEVGLAVLGALLGDPGVTVGPAVVGASVVGAAVVGEALGDPGVKVGPAVVGTPVVGLAVAGALLGDPGVTVGAAIVGVAAGLLVAQSK